MRSGLTPLMQRWQTLAPRERRLLALAAAVVGLAALWWIALAPALGTLRQSEARHRALDQEWQHMQQLQAQAQELKSSPRMTRQEALQALEAGVRQRLGAAAQLQVQGDRATLTLKGVPAQALADWLTQTRLNARMLPSEAHLSRNTGGSAGPVLWDGTLVLAVPAS